MRLHVLLLGTIVTTATAQQPTDTARAQKRVIQLPGSLPGLPLSTAVQVGNVIYLSGQIGVFPGTRQLVDTGVTKQTQQTLDNIKAVLANAGSSMERVFKCTVFLSNIRDFDDMNRVYATYFPKDPPARSTVAGSGLALGAKVEIECLATAGP
jgi:2-iminobutanoate/2-iminopropanoate deaminase